MSLFNFVEDNLFHGNIGFFIQNIKEVLQKKILQTNSKNIKIQGVFEKS